MYEDQMTHATQQTCGQGFLPLPCFGFGNKIIAIYCEELSYCIFYVSTN